MEALLITSAALKGFFIATEIILIVVGALMVLEILRSRNLLDFLRKLFSYLSEDRRVQAILIGWALVHAIEGAAGFGTPAVLAVPLFLALGFRPLLAVSLALIGDSVPVIFGAIGLPVTYGIGSVLGTLGINGNFLQNIAESAAKLNLVGSLIVTALIVAVLIFSERAPKKSFFEFIPFAFVSGLAVSIPAFLTARFIGPELPSLIGGLAGLAIIAFMARRKFLLPKNTFRFSNDFPEPEKISKIEPQERAGILKALLPYLAIVAVLTVSRLPFLPVKNFLTSIAPVKIQELFGFQINYSFFPFYAAGPILIFIGIASLFLFQLNLSEKKDVLTKVMKKSGLAYASLIFVVALVQIFIYSGENSLGLASMPMEMSGAAKDLFGYFWPLVAPFVGAIGAFVAGSATVSNLLFTDFQYKTALATGYAPVLILTLQGIGAAAGNMIALSNVIAAAAVAGIIGEENKAIRKNILPLVFYLLIIGVVGWFLL